MRKIQASIWITGHELGIFEQEPGDFWDEYVNVILQRQEKLLSLLSRPRDRQEIVEAWSVNGKAREPRYFFEFGEWAIMQKHLEKLMWLGRVAHEQGRYLRRDGS